MRPPAGECPCGWTRPPAGTDADATDHAGRCVAAFVATTGRPRAVVARAVGGYLQGHPTAGYRRADIESDAWWGMALALTRYDPSRGAGVWTWASVRVQGSILDGERTRARQAARCGSHYPLSADALPWDRGGLDPSLARVDDMDAIVRCLALVPPRQAAILARTYLDGDTLAEVAADLGITESGATRARQAAVHAIRAALSQRRAAAAA